MKLVESENKRALEAAHEVLAAHFAHDGHALDLLNHSVAEINRLLPALTLLPEGGLFERLVVAAPCDSDVRPGADGVGQAALAEQAFQRREGGFPLTSSTDRAGNLS